MTWNLSLPSARSVLVSTGDPMRQPLETVAAVVRGARGRDTGCPVPPAQIPAGGITAPALSLSSVGKEAFFRPGILDLGRVAASV